MLIVISPAKTLDYTTPIRTRTHTEPAFLQHSRVLVGLMRKKKPTHLRSLLGISEPLAELNHERFKAWSPQHTATNSRQALLAFMGDVYSGLDAHSLDSRELAFAQKHLRILSGLYGLLRPLDLMQAYRLEMGTRLNNPAGGDLYHYWGDQPTLALNRQAATLRTRYLVNLASNEYFKAVRLPLLEVQVITPIFKEYRDGKYRVLSFFAKKARGMMARHIIRSRARNPRALLDFNEAGYCYNETLSNDQELVFSRKQP